MKFIITKLLFIYRSTTFKMKHIEDLHHLVVKEGKYDSKKRQYDPLEVHLDGFLLEKFEG